MDLNWQALRVNGEHRSAIYGEQFPTELTEALSFLTVDVSAAFDQERALAVLVTFATSWTELRSDGQGRTDFIGLRQHPANRVEAILVFYAIELSPGQVVVTSVSGHRVE